MNTQKLLVTIMLGYTCMLLTACSPSDANESFRPLGATPGPIIIMTWRTSIQCTGWGTGSILYPTIFSTYRPESVINDGGTSVTFPDVSYYPLNPLSSLVAMIPPGYSTDTPCTVSIEPGSWTFEIQMDPPQQKTE
jgi:hypothetical protein